MKIILKPNKKAFPANEPMLADLLPDDGRLLEQMLANFQNTKTFLLSLPEDKLQYRYDDGKSTVKEVIVHLIDLERIYAYRALRFARKDQRELPSFDGDKYVLSARANGRLVSNLLTEYETVRAATISMAESFDHDALNEAGIANGTATSVAALLYHIAGHELHHMQIIRDRYLQ